MEQLFTYVAPCLFGIESILASEIRALSYEVTEVSDGRVFFKGDVNAAARANINLRCAERVLILLAEFNALTFDELFEGVKAAPLADFLPSDARFPVTGHSLKSKLASVPDCQRIIKKAAVDNLSKRYGIKQFPESGDLYPLSFLLFKDRLHLMLDLSGEGLHKRGYRQKANLAPLRETIAAAMVKLTRYRAGTPFWDPFAGSGTIAIEAAMIASNMAPGLKRRFVCENYSFLNKQIFDGARAEAIENIRKENFSITATDIDPAMKSLGESNAGYAGVSKYIRFDTLNVSDISTDEPGGIICCNPPYGERLLEQKGAQRIYSVMGESFSKLHGWKYFVITSDEQFESCFGKKADKKRKLYNGMIKCDFYQYFK